MKWGYLFFLLLVFGFFLFRFSFTSLVAWRGRGRGGAIRLNNVGVHTQNPYLIGFWTFLDLADP